MKSVINSKVLFLQNNKVIIVIPNKKKHLVVHMCT